MAANPLTRTPTSEHDEMLLVLRHLLPAQKCWFHTVQLDKVLFERGFTNLPPRFVSSSLKSKRAAEMFFACEKFSNKKWYCFHPKEMKYASPRDQVGFLKAASTDEERAAVVPAISPGYFGRFEYTFLSKYVTGDAPSRPPAPLPDERLPDAEPSRLSRLPDGTLPVAELERRKRVFRQRMNDSSLTIRDIDTDGNCMFRSVADQMYGDPSDRRTMTLRRLACDFLERHKDRFSHGVTEDDDDIDQHILKMRRPGEYGTNAELVALSAILQVKIYVYGYLYHPTPYLIRDESVLTPVRDPLRISYHNQIHYNSVVDQLDGPSARSAVDQLDDPSARSAVVSPMPTS